MTEELSPKDTEARAARRLRLVGVFVTVVWIAGLVVYFWGLASTESGLRWPSIDPRAWRENVGFLVDWTSLLALSGSFIALLWWPKHVVETIFALWARHRDKVRAFLSDLLGSLVSNRATGSSSQPREPNVPPSRFSKESSNAAFEETPQTPAQPSAASSRQSVDSRRARAWKRIFVATAVAVVGFSFLGWAFNRTPLSDKSSAEKPIIGRDAIGSDSNRVYIMREGDGQGAVEAITRGISDPIVRARCTEALESDPMNRPPQDRRQRPGHVVLLPTACPTP
jgi:hypothetical protein